MTNTFLVMKDSRGQTIRVRADAIAQYSGDGQFSTLIIEGAAIDVLHHVDCIDKALTEAYFMLKKVEQTLEDA